MFINIGDVIRGKYKVEQVLGAGGMGIVLAAWDPDLERRVAIKVLQPEMLVHPEIVQRFLREARAAAKIQSDHVAQVVEVSLLDDGAPFMVMEYLEGHDLSHEARGGARPCIGEAVSWVLEACRAIKEAHRIGIVHRDLKPANLFLAKRCDGTVRIKVLDFGISKITDPVDSGKPGITRTSIVMGSPEYMSPEQMLSTRDVDVRSDIWSLGIILYQLCTGKVPYPGETVTQVYARVTAKPVDPPRSLRPQMPPDLDAVIMSCLAVDRTKRIATVAVLMERLSPFAAATQVSQRDGGVSGFVATQAVEAIAPPVQGATVLLPDAAPEGERVESRLQSQAESLPARVPAPRGPSTTGVVSSDPLTPPPTRALWPFALTGVGLVGAAVFTVAVIGRSAAPPPASATAAIVPNLAVQRAKTPSQTEPTVEAAPASSADVPSASTSAAIVPPVEKRRATISSISKKLPATAIPNAPTTSAAAGCDPPYAIDGAGHRTIKPECNK